MYWLKWHLACVVASVFDAALRVDRAVPYFPIEISRMAASGPAALWRFRWGVTLLPLTALATDFVPDGGEMAHALLVVAWCGLVAVVWFDDKHHWSEHMTGLYMMLAALFALGYKTLGYDAWPRLALVVATSLLAKALKVASIVLYESAGNYAEFFVPNFASAMHARAQRIMLGEEVPKHTLTRHAFRAGGVLQWAGFCVLASLF